MRVFNAEFGLADILSLMPSAMKASFSHRKIMNACRVLKSERKRAETVEGLPFALMVEPSAICDMKCPMCALQRSAPRQPAFMDMETYTAIINELCATSIFFSLWDWGEPLLNENIGAMARMATGKKIMTVMHTNGKNLGAEMSESLISSGLCYLVISMDGARAVTYGAIRGKENFSTVTDNTMDFMEQKKKLRSRTPVVELKMILTKENENEIQAFKKLGAQLGVDRITFRRLVTYHNPENAGELLPARKEFQCAGADGHGPPAALYCNRPWRSSVITTNGDVVPCCIDSGFRHVMGNIHGRGGFAAVWNNEKYRSFRRKLAEDPESIGMCKDCTENSFRGDIFIKPE
jgi:radical SAM protein with 4Fe4S-binding SPASM domain